MTTSQESPIKRPNSPKVRSIWLEMALVTLVGALGAVVVAVLLVMLWKPA